jgi:hypothetical protein
MSGRRLPHSPCDTHLNDKPGRTIQSCEDQVVLHRVQFESYQLESYQRCLHIRISLPNGNRIVARCKSISASVSKLN